MESDNLQVDLLPQFAWILHVLVVIPGLLKKEISVAFSIILQTFIGIFCIISKFTAAVRIIIIGIHISCNFIRKNY